jgi:hypothetical protein
MLLDQTTGPEKSDAADGRKAMKRSFLVITFLTLTCAAVLAPIRTTTPILLSSADGADWKCTTSAFVITTCLPTRDVRTKASASNLASLR